MAQAGNVTTNYIVEMLGEPTGLPFSVAAVAERAGVELESLNPGRILSQNIAFETAERSTGAQYPAMYVYCEKLSNLLTEKFRTFSGKARMAIEVRVSQDRLEGMQRLLELYVEAVTDVLDAHRGNWGSGMFYAGGYEASFGGIKHGGKNFIQTGKVMFEVDISLG